MKKQLLVSKKVRYCLGSLTAAAVGLAAGWFALAGSFPVGERTAQAAPLLNPSGLQHINKDSPARSTRPSSGLWELECADCPKSFEMLSDRSLVLDADGYPHIAYGGDHLYYAWFDGAAWNYATVDASPGVGLHASLALDADGFPHISYFDNTNETLKYAYLDPGGWQIETVDSCGVTSTSLSVSPASSPHIAYTTYNTSYPNFGLRYATWKSSTGWEITRVDWGRMGASLQLDQAGFPHISYFKTFTTLKYAVLDVGGWYSTTIDTIPGGYGYFTSLALDAEDKAYISYQLEDLLKYAQEENGSWLIETIDDYANPGRPNSIGLDHEYNPHISYQRDGRLIYASRASGGNWQLTDLDPGGFGTSLAMDAAGFPHISHVQEINNETSLQYVHLDGTGWHTHWVDDSVSVYGSSSIALDDMGAPHISYSYQNANLMYAKKITTTWQLETVVSPGSGSSVVLDDENYPHIVFSGSGLKYAYRNAGGWQFETIDDHGGGSSAAIDASGNVHVTYRYYNLQTFNDELRYAYRDAGGWHITVVQTTHVTIGYSSLALDADGYPHISYKFYNYSPAELRHAYLDAGGWHIETVEQAEINNATSIALDSDGYPHIAYPAAGQLKYAFQDAGGWHITTVTEEANTVGDLSMALDAANYPHISYYEETNQDLKVAYLDAGGWHIEALEFPGGRRDVERPGPRSGRSGPHQLPGFHQQGPEVCPFEFPGAPYGSNCQRSEHRVCRSAVQLQRRGGPALDHPAPHLHLAGQRAGSGNAHDRIIRHHHLYLGDHGDQTSHGHRRQPVWRRHHAAYDHALRAGLSPVSPDDPAGRLAAQEICKMFPFR